jgi:hypothetical protein
MSFLCMPKKPIVQEKAKLGDLKAEGAMWRVKLKSGWSDILNHARAVDLSKDLTGEYSDS